MNKNICNIIPIEEYQDTILNETEASLAKTGQGAIELFTSGGKTFIGVHLVCNEIDNNPNKNILWMSIESANRNVKSSVISRLPVKYKSKIKFKSYESVWRGDSNLPIDLNDIGLIVFDESHRALTRKGKEPILSLIKQCNCKLLAMSATKRRSDGQQSFKILVPKAIYSDYNLSWGAERDIINDLNYCVYNTNIAAFDYNTLARYEELGKRYRHIQEECDQLRALMDNYKFNLSKNVYEAIKDSGMSTDSMDGGRHIVFFSTIEEAEKNEETIKNIFERLYPYAEVKTYQYHGKIPKSRANYILDNVINSDHDEYQVDVIITVNRGTESIHPRNIKSVLMFRNTQSEIVFTQQIGRGVTLKNFGSGGTYIFDFCNNCVSLIKGSNIQYGRRALDERGALFNEVMTLEQLTEEIKKSILAGVKINATFATEEIREISNRLSKAAESLTMLEYADTLHQICKLVKVRNRYGVIACGINELESEFGMSGKENKINDPRGIWDKAESKFTDNFIKWFKSVRYKFLQGKIEDDSHLDQVISELGHLFYLNIEGNQSETNNQLTVIDQYLALTPESSKKATSMALAEMNNLKVLNSNDGLEVVVSMYARARGVDFSVGGGEIRRLKKKAEAEGDRAIRAHAFYSKRVAELENFRAKRNSLIDKLKTGTLVDDYNEECGEGSEESYEDYEIRRKEEINLEFLRVKARMQTGSRLHIIPFASNLVAMMEKEYAPELNHGTIKQPVLNEANELIGILINVSLHKGITVIQENWLFDHPVYRELNQYLKEVLRTFKISRPKEYKELLNKTTFMKNYNLAVTGDYEALKFMSGMKLEGLDKFRLKLMTSPDIQDKLDNYRTDYNNRIVLDKVATFIKWDLAKAQEVENAVRNMEITPNEVVKMAFNRDNRECAMRYLRYKGSITEFKNDNPKDYETIRGNCISYTSCIKIILENLSKIPSVNRTVGNKIAELRNLR